MNKGPILLVEDNSNDVELISRELDKRCAEKEVVLAEDGRMAMDYLFGSNGSSCYKHHKIPSIIILDLDLGETRGEQVLKRIRSESRTLLVPVIIFSASELEKSVETVYRDGANSFVHKPANYSNFRQAVGAIVDYWLKVNKGALIREKS